MKHVLLINNERDADDMGWNFRLERALKQIEPGLMITVLHHQALNDEEFRKINPSHTIFYGRVTHHWDMKEILEDYRPELEFLRKTEHPTLCICAGHQLLGIAHGCDMDKMIQCEDMDILETGYCRITKDKPCRLFENLPSPFFGYNQHRDELKQIPEGFERTATGNMCAIQAMQKIGAPVFGLQFHPEWAIDQFPAGRMILENFLSI